MARRFFFFFDVVIESEDEEGIPLFIFPVTDDLFFLRYYFETFQVDNALWSRIYQRECTHKNSKDNDEDRGFWDLNYQNTSQQKMILA